MASLRLAKARDVLTPFSFEVGFDLIFGAVLQAMRSASDARLSPRDVPNFVGGILRALGVKADEVERALRQLDQKTPRLVTPLRRQSPADPKGWIHDGDKSGSF